MQEQNIVDKFSFKNQNTDFCIEEIHKGDVTAIVEFQKHLAFDSEGIELDLDNVNKGAHFVIDNQEYGFHFIMRTLDPSNENVSFALICPEYDIYQNQNVWWYNSVYTEKKYRRRGLFTNLHQFILNWAGKSKIKLYADEHNEAALKCYEKLGMKDTNEIFVEIDFYFTQVQIEFERNKDVFNIYFAKLQNLDTVFDIFNNLISINDKPNLVQNEGFKHLLTSIKYGGVICITENVDPNDIICMAVFGYEYSEWKLGLNVIIPDIRFKKDILENNQKKAELMIQNIVSYFRNETKELESSVQSVRFIVDRNNTQSINLLKNSKLEPSHYIILSN